MTLIKMSTQKCKKVQRNNIQMLGQKEKIDNFQLQVHVYLFTCLSQVNLPKNMTSIIEFSYQGSA